MGVLGVSPLTAGVGDEAIVELALHAPPEARSEIIRRKCGPDTARCRRLEDLVSAGAALSSLHSPPAAERDRTAFALSVGDVLGRYVVLGVLGAGAMGEVYAAFDRELQRRVALKLLHVPWVEVRARLLREAQLLARVEHPNVVTVYDVGESSEHGYIAMELVAGLTLRQWLGTRRGWPEFVRVMLAAGHGLAAAHAAGVVHRDFKPDNVLLDPDARPVVSDFGIAWMPSDPDAPQPRGGTPRYMSPEQWAGQAQGFATDTFAFCKVLAEGLPPDAPRWLRQIARRGLEPVAAERWPSMRHVLQAIEQRQRRRWARPVCAALGLAGALMAAVVPSGPPETLAIHSVCEEPTDLSWMAPATDAARSSLYAAEQDPPARFASRRIDEAANGLRALNERACMTSADAACSEQIAARLRAALESFEVAEDTASVWKIAAQLDADCGVANPRALPRDVRARLETLLARGHQASVRGQARLAATYVRDAVALADRSEHAGVAVEVRLRGAAALVVEGRVDAAMRLETDAAWLASAAGLREPAARAALLVARHAGSHEMNLEQAEQWVHRATMMLPEPVDQPLAARLLAASAMVARGSGDYLGGEVQMRAALQIRRDLEPTGIETAQTVAALAVMLQHQGRFEEALALFEEAVASMSSTLDPRHPALAVPMYGAATSLAQLGRLERAEHVARAVLDIERAAHGDAFPLLASDYALLATILGAREQETQAREAWCAARRRAAALAREHPLVRDIEDNVQALDIRCDSTGDVGAPDSVREGAS